MENLSHRHGLNGASLSDSPMDESKYLSDESSFVDVPGEFEYYSDESSFAGDPPGEFEYISDSEPPGGTKETSGNKGKAKETYTSRLRAVAQSSGHFLRSQGPPNMGVPLFSCLNDTINKLEQGGKSTASEQNILDDFDIFNKHLVEFQGIFMERFKNKRNSKGHGYSFSEPPRLICDNCESGIKEREIHFHCNICEPHCDQCKNGNFDLCESCFKAGAHCLSTDHILTSRTVRLGSAVELKPRTPALPGRSESVQNRSDLRDNSKVQQQDAPLYEALKKYLEATDLSKHPLKEQICLAAAVSPVDPSTPNSKILSYWAITCNLLAADEFEPSFRSTLSPIQIASIRILKEWWLAEIQDVQLIAKFITSLIREIIFPGVPGFDPVDKFTSGRLVSNYHESLANLFVAEFTPSTTPTRDGRVLPTLSETRTAAAIDACIQRSGYLQHRPLLKPHWLRFRPKTVPEMFEASEVWMNQIRFESAGALMLLMQLGFPEERFWMTLAAAIVGPVFLFCRNFEDADQILGTNSLSPSLAPLTRLSATVTYSSLPHYLWDVRARKTVEVSTLSIRPQYVAISHTWGRWMKNGSPRVVVPGVPWSIAQNSLWDVSQIPEMLQRVPGPFQYVWFDLVCIPQIVEDSTILSDVKKQEIAKQAGIFGNATNAIAWLSDMRSFISLQTMLGLMGLMLVEFPAVDEEREVLIRERPELNPDFAEVLKLPRIREDIFPALARNDVSAPLDLHKFPMDLIHQWFSSLWTLQEAYMRPDMWICKSDWTPLQLYECDTLKPGYYVSLDGILALINGCIKKGALTSSPAPDPSSYMELSGDIQGTSSEASDLLRKRKTQFCAPYLDDYSEIRASHDVNMSIRYNKRVSGTRIAVPELKKFVVMMAASGITGILHASPIQILALGERRDCKERRSEAIMSAIGAVDWHASEANKSEVILNRYESSFIDEVRTKFGDGEFFSNATLTFKALDLISAHDLTGSEITAIGTLLPFGRESVFEMTLDAGIPSGSSEHTARDYQEQLSHDSLGSWKILSDGSVIVSRACILQSSYDRHEYCTRNHFGVLQDIHDLKTRQDQGNERGASHVVSSYQSFDISSWIATRDYMCYFICLVRKGEYFPPSKQMRWRSEGVILRELEPGVLVTIGKFISSWELEDNLQHIFPSSTEVGEWRVL